MQASFDSGQGIGAPGRTSSGEPMGALVALYISWWPEIHAMVTCKRECVCMWIVRVGMQWRGSILCKKSSMTLWLYVSTSMSPVLGAVVMAVVMTCDSRDVGSGTSMCV